MRMNEIDFSGPPPIDSYASGGFRIAGEWHIGDLIVTSAGPQPIGAAWPGRDALAPILAERDALDLVLIGQGAEIASLNPTVRKCLEDAGLGVEHMSTPSACRTYNVLLTENRRVAAILIAM